MNLKISAVLALALYLGSSYSMASTAIECSGEGKTLKVEFDQNQSGAIEAAVKFGDLNVMSELPQKMKIDVLILPAGSFYSDKEVRSYTGSYITDDLKIGFAVSQTFNSLGVMDRQLKNVFGMNQMSIGTCQVTQSE